MVRIFSMYHFNGQMVDTVDDLSALTVTDRNKLLIAQDDYSVEVKDLLSDKKMPAFVFSTVEKVHQICHCASGNYVATVEGEQAFQKSDRLVVRIYTNWELNFVGSKRPSSYSKRLVRPRIAGVVTPSIAKTDEDFLDMIEIPISFTSPTILSVCQSSGKLLITCGPTMHLFSQIYTRSNHGKTPYFMDFVPYTEVFQLDFLPIAVTINADFIASYSSEFVSVFRVKKLMENDLLKMSEYPGANSNANVSDAPKNRIDSNFIDKEPKDTFSCPVNVDEVFNMIRDNQEDQIIKFIDFRSLPLVVSLKGINDGIVSMRAKQLPFQIFEKKDKYIYRNGKVQDTLVETLCDKDLSVIAESVLAVRMKDPDEIITNIALQVLCIETQEDDEMFSSDHKRLVSINVLVTTYQEGYLFYAAGDDLQESLRCVAIFSFTSQVISLMFEACFLHVLTRAGLETYNIPSLHSTILHEKPNLDKFSQHVSIIGMHPFMGIVDFISSKDLIVIFTSASDGKVGRESLPWTVYSLKIPKLFEVYQEMIENSNSFKSRDECTYRYLSLESFLILQTGLNMNLNLCDHVDESLVKSTHQINSIELAKIYFRSGNDPDVKIASLVILAAELDPIQFVQSLEFEKSDISLGKIYLMKKWIEKRNVLSEEEAEWLMKMFDESNEIIQLSLLILSNKSICRSCGHKAIPCLRKFIESKNENPDVRVVFVLAILYTQQCFQDGAVLVLSFIKNGDTNYRKSFIDIVLKFWTFLFEEIYNNEVKKIFFSDLTSVLCENLPSEIAEILAELILKENIVSISDVVQMLMMQFPCCLSVQKSAFILRTILEKFFSSKVRIDYDDADIINCLKILGRSYLSDLMNQNVSQSKVYLDDYEPIFVENLPAYIDYLPLVNNVNYFTLRRFQEFICSKMLNEESVKELIHSIPNELLKLNLLALLNNAEFAKDLIEHNCFVAVIPYVKNSFNNVKKWRDFISFIQFKITELNEFEKDTAPCQQILKDILDHLASNLTPTQLNTVLELTISKNDELYWNSIIKAQQISFANDVKELIINTSQQLIHSNSVH